MVEPKATLLESKKTNQMVPSGGGGGGHFQNYRFCSEHARTVMQITYSRDHGYGSPIRFDQFFQKGDRSMPTAKSETARKATKQVCHICGKECDSYFCGPCSDKVRAEAMTKKKLEDKGKA